MILRKLLPLVLVLAACDDGGHGPTLPPLTGPHDTTGIVSPSFTVAATTTTSTTPPVTPPPTPPWDNNAPVPTIIVPAPTEAPQRPSRPRPTQPAAPSRSRGS